jgi:hypothetical protein
VPNLFRQFSSSAIRQVSAPHLRESLPKRRLLICWGIQVERVYRRGDALEKRRVPMDAWAAFCALQERGGVVAKRKK